MGDLGNRRSIMGHRVRTPGLTSLAVVALIGFLGLAAAADIARTPDGNDTPGRLDAKLSTHRHDYLSGVPQWLIRHTLTTRSTWQPRMLGNGSSYLTLYFDGSSQ